MQTVAGGGDRGGGRGGPRVVLLNRQQGGYAPDEVAAQVNEDARITPPEARSILSMLPQSSRQLLAQVVAPYLVQEEIPGISVPTEHLAAVIPLVEAGLLRLEDGDEQHLYDGLVWGRVPDGLVGVGRELRLIALVLALLSDQTQSAVDWYVWEAEKLGRLRVYPYAEHQRPATAS